MPWSGKLTSERQQGGEGDETELVPNPNESKFKQCYVIIVIYLPRGAHIPGVPSQQSHCWRPWS